MSRVLLASRNPKKLIELRDVVADAGIAGLEIIGLNDVPPFSEAPEVGPTFEDNALAKARDAYEATGIVALADDSGIEVDALNGMPGVLSARWSGRHGDDAANVTLLLSQMNDVPDERRGGRFVSACAIVGDGWQSVVRGEWCGRIVRRPRGVGGFGYDPVFEPVGFDCVAAELSASEKNAVSHRKRALEQLVPHLRELAG